MAEDGSAECTNLVAEEPSKDDVGVKDETFEPAIAFQGVRHGFCFKLGPRGLGSYRDLKPMTSGVLSHEMTVGRWAVPKPQLVRPEDHQPPPSVSNSDNRSSSGGAVASGEEDTGEEWG